MTPRDVTPQLRNDASGGILVDTKEPGLAELRAELARRTLSPEHMKIHELATRPGPATTTRRGGQSPRGHLHGGAVTPF